jgi:hypothetical protein
MDTYTMQLVKKELESRENLLWSGRPKQGIIFRGADVFMIPFSLLWCGFAIFWEVSVANSGGSPFFLLFGGFFVFIGLYFVFGRFLWDSAQRKKTFYGITNERVIILSGLFQKQVKSINLKTLSDISVSEKSNGQGTISLGPTSFMESMYGGMAWPGVPQGAPKLESVEEAKRVYNILRGAQGG